MAEGVAEGVSWGDFEAAMPEMASAGRALLFKHGVGLGYLATIRPNGGPRLHPFCPIVAVGGLYGFINHHSPKSKDLVRDGRYAIHAFPNGDNDDELSIDGRAVVVDDPIVIEAVRAAYGATYQTPSEETLFEFRIERALLALYDAQSTWPPAYTKWRVTGLV
ncbi:MAG TPA: pyridoxamine 5'-phosphate oxidase family protein [Acidimicrobiales bacterium]|nr:pyridoxamine 5'-phosphate oxidase family protein [Acidimicrobiales bacterium]